MFQIKISGKEAFHMWLDSLDEEYLVTKIWPKGLLYNISTSFVSNYDSTNHVLRRAKIKKQKNSKCPEYLHNMFDYAINSLPERLNVVSKDSEFSISAIVIGGPTLCRPNPRIEKESVVSELVEPQFLLEDLFPYYAKAIFTISDEEEI